MARGVVARTWRETAPDAIEPDLAAMWRELARTLKVARAVMANLVVFRERTGARIADFDAIAGGLPLDAVAARHPSRVIILDHERGRSAAEPPFAAAAGIVAFGPPQARYAIEEIAVQSACAERSLPSIVRALARGSTPTSIWWTEDLSRVPPIAALVDAGRQFLYDSRRWRDARRGTLAVGALLERERRIDLADVNWRRLTPFRHALLHASTAVELDAIRDRRVHVTHRPGDAALAWLLVGWLGAQLRWTPGALPNVEEARLGDEVLSLAVGGTPPDLTITMNGHRILVKHAGGMPPFTTAVPHETDADAIAAELRNLSHDVCLHGAIRTLVAHMR